MENYLNFEGTNELLKINNSQLRSLCTKMTNTRKNDCLMGRSFSSTLRILLNRLNNEFFEKYNINPDSPINVASRTAFQNKRIYLYITINL